MPEVFKNIFSGIFKIFCSKRDFFSYPIPRKELESHERKKALEIKPSVGCGPCRWCTGVKMASENVVWVKTRAGPSFGLL